MKFTHQYDETSPRIEVEIHRDSTLTEVLGAFQDFLRAAGYAFLPNEQIEVVDDSAEEGQ